MKYSLKPATSNNSHLLCQPNKSVLYQKYIAEQKSSEQIAKELGCSYTTILNWLKKLDIPTRKKNEKIDLTNQKFGRLLVIRESGKKVNGKIYWVCRCDCGNLTTVRGGALRKNWTKSCSCLRKETARKATGINNNNYRHGDATRKGGTRRLYIIWRGMKDRCYNININYKRYKYYGGKGIEVCKEWKDNYLTFKKWALNSGYEEGLSIDRKESDKNYEPSNCQWLTRSSNSIKAINLRVAKSMPVRFTTA